ncbi:MAG: acyl-ACP--UDP-N-acetylglucosamine O-acyltransferase [Desulfovibrio sp.]
MANKIHPTAVIEDNVTIGENVTIGAYSVIEADCVIGDDCILDSFAQIKRYTRMGKGNHIHSYACVGDEPQHLGYKGEETYVELGDNNSIREHVTIHRGTVQGHGFTKIGSNCLLMAYSHVAHDCIVADHVTMANAATLAGHVEVGSHVIISGVSAVQQFSRIGDYAFLGGMSGFSQDVPPFMLANGIRARLYGPNVIGLKRHGFSKDARKALKKAYKMIFRTTLTRDEALQEVEAEYSDIPEVMTLVEFVRTTKQGIVPDVGKGK